MTPDPHTEVSRQAVEARYRRGDNHLAALEAASNNRNAAQDRYDNALIAARDDGCPWWAMAYVTGLAMSTVRGHVAQALKRQQPERQTP